MRDLPVGVDQSSDAVSLPTEFSSWIRCEYRRIIWVAFLRCALSRAVSKLRKKAATKFAVRLRKRSRDMMSAGVGISIHDPSPIRVKGFGVVAFGA